jgi:hypothetical protein
MTWFADLNVSYHQQDTDYYCGAAAAQMVLDSIGSGLLDQNLLYASNHSHSAPGWYTSPDGLNYTLNALKPLPPTFDSFFVVDVSNTEPNGSAIIISTLRYFSVAPVTLVYGTGHWVVVRGAKTDVDPAEAGGAYTIEGFYINNPWPPTPSFYDPTLAPPPPHSDPDACGSGGNRGSENEYVTYAEWQNTYFTGGDAYGVGYPQFVSVCDPRRPPMGTLKVIGHPRLKDGSRIISAQEALSFAAHALETHELAKHDCPLAHSLRGARPDGAHLVQRLDREDEFYYLVTVHQAGKPTAILRGDALYGTFHGALALQNVEHPPIIEREAALSALRNSIVDLGDGLGRIPLREGGFSVYPTLVWRPCMESRSPYYPFHQINIGNRTIYVGYNGRVYPTLHDLGRG